MVTAESRRLKCADSTDDGKEVEERGRGRGSGNGENSVGIDRGRLDGRQSRRRTNPQVDGRCRKLKVKDRSRNSKLNGGDEKKEDVSGEDAGADDETTEAVGEEAEGGGSCLGPYLGTYARLLGKALPSLLGLSGALPGLLGTLPGLPGPYLAYLALTRRSSTVTYLALPGLTWPSL